MKLDEVTKRDIGVNYDESAAASELRKRYADVDFETIDRVFRGAVAREKEMQSLISQIKSKYSLSSRTNQETTNQLLQLMLNIRKSDIKVLGDIWREKKHEV
jgi:hypothetical protein